MVHNLSDKANQMDAGFNTIDAKLIDFIGALEPILHYPNISDEDKNSIKYAVSNWNLLPKTRVRKNDAPWH